MRKSDETAKKHYFRAGDRYFRIEDKWFYTTREGDEGPFASREQAQAHLKMFVAMQELTEDKDTNVVVHGKTSVPGEKPRAQLDTSIWDRQADAL